MQLSKTAVHAIYALCYLNRQGQDRSASASAIGKAISAPPEHARKILGALCSAGMIRSSRGRSGGYSLAKDLTQISVLDVADAVSPGLAQCAARPRMCPVAPFTRCCVQPGLVALQEQMREVAAATALSMLSGPHCRSLGLATQVTRTHHGSQAAVAARWVAVG